METTVLERLGSFLHGTIAPEELALQFRRLKLEVVRLLLQDEQGLYNKEWLTDGLFYLDALCEVLDPYLEASPSGGQ